MCILRNVEARNRIRRSSVEWYVEDETDFSFFSLNRTEKCIESENFAYLGNSCRCLRRSFVNFRAVRGANLHSYIISIRASSHAFLSTN